MTIRFVTSSSFFLLLSLLLLRFRYTYVCAMYLEGIGWRVLSIGVSFDAFGVQLLNISEVLLHSLLKGLLGVANVEHVSLLAFHFVDHHCSNETRANGKKLAYRCN